MVRDKSREREGKEKKMDGDGEGEREGRVFHFTHMNEFFNSTAREYSPLSKGLT